MVADHEALQLGCVEDFGRERLVRGHDERGGGEVEEPGRVRVQRHGVAQRGDRGPRRGRVRHEVVVGGVGEEGRVAVAVGVVEPVLFDVVDVRGAEGGVEGCDDDGGGGAGGAVGAGCA